MGLDLGWGLWRSRIHDTLTDVRAIDSSAELFAKAIKRLANSETKDLPHCPYGTGKSFSSNELPSNICQPRSHWQCQSCEFPKRRWPWLLESGQVDVEEYQPCGQTQLEMAPYHDGMDWVADSLFSSKAVAERTRSPKLLWGTRKGALGSLVHHGWLI